METEFLKLTKDNYKQYHLNDVVAISVAQPGAMGDPGSIKILSSKGEKYYANPWHDNISVESVYCVCPLLSHIRISVIGCISKPIGWHEIYLGCGNHLFINDTIYSQFQLGVKYLENKEPYDLYNEWMGIVQDIVGNRIFSKVIEDKVKGVIFGQAIGDALGLSTEFMSDEEMAWKYPNGVKDYSDIFQDRHRKRWKIGDWTDDTDMMLCIANAVIKDKGVNLTSIAKNFKEWAEDEPMGIGENTYKVLTIGDYVEKPLEVSKKVWEMSNRKSAANGGLMRTSIVGLFPKAVEQCAANICRLTHYDPRCVGSCVIVSLIIHSIVYHSTELTYHQIIDISKKYDERICEYVDLARNSDIRALELQNEHSMGYTLKTLATALWAYWNAKSFEEGLLTVVNAGGDADTNAAVACAILGAKYGYSSIPKEYIEGLIHREQLDELTIGFLELYNENSNYNK